MRLIVALLAGIAFVAADSHRPAAAQWCAYYDIYTYNCGFRTHRQCLDTIAGIGGWCSRDLRAEREAERSRTRTLPPPDRRDYR